MCRQDVSVRHSWNTPRHTECPRLPQSVPLQQCKFQGCLGGLDRTHDAPQSQRSPANSVGLPCFRRRDGQTDLTQAQGEKAKGCIHSGKKHALESDKPLKIQPAQKGRKEDPFQSSSSSSVQTKTRRRVRFRNGLLDPIPFNLPIRLRTDGGGMALGAGQRLRLGSKREMDMLAKGRRAPRSTIYANGRVHGH